MKKTDIQTDDPGDKMIGEYVATDYRTSQVFEKYGIDFCCGGKVSLSATCKEKSLDLKTILREIENIKNEPTERGQDYDSWELPFLSDYIINVHHAYLKGNTDQILAYVLKIEEVHGANHPELHPIARLFTGIASDMAAHLIFEEAVFFPAIKKVAESVKTEGVPLKEDIDTIMTALDKLILEHDKIGNSVHEIRHLSMDYKIPGDACNTFTLTYQKLKEFEDDLHKHVHLENNILFVKAAQYQQNNKISRDEH